MLPTATLSSPEARSSSSVRLVTVVLPLVPVIAHQRSGDSSHATSGSNIFWVLAALAQRKNSRNSDIPGLATQISNVPATYSVP